MKYLLMTVLAGFIIINSTIANDDEKPEKRGRKKEVKKHEKGQWKILENISNEERERLRKLHATSPDAFKKEIAKIIKRVKQEKQELDKKIKNLVNQYKSAKDDETKKESLEELRKITQKIFLEKMKKNKKRLESLEKQVKALREQYDFRQKNADKIIQSRLDTLTNNENFEW